MNPRQALIREAQDPKTSPERLAELAAHPDPAVRRAVARNHGQLGADSVARLLEDGSWEVRAVAAHHPKANKDRATAIVVALATAPEAGQRAVGSRSKLMPTDILATLAKDADPEVRSNASKNPRTPADAARAGLTDSEPCVVLGALCHPSVTKQERQAFVNEDLLTRFFEAHADGEHLFEALCDRYLWEVLERAFPDPEKFDDVWQDLVKEYFELVEIPSRSAVLAAVHRKHWTPVIKRLADEVRGGGAKQTM